MGFLDKYFTTGNEEEEISKMNEVNSEQVIETESNDTKTLVHTNINGDDIIPKLYANNKTNDPSIFKVEEYINTLPEEMTDKRKLETILGILSVSGLSVEGLLRDGEGRVSILRDYKDSVISEKNQIIESAKSDIQQMKAMIESLNQKIAEEEIQKNDLSAIVENEINHVMRLVNFIGMEGK